MIEAAPEDLELKRELFAEVARHVAADCVLATNTSSLSVTALAAGVPGPERVVGMHFFNPPPVMRLVEVVAGERSGEPALAAPARPARRWASTSIDAADGAGFLVNRCNRPFALEALRLVEQRLATPEQVDRICRMAGGFRMGPFELMDLVGIDVGFTISQSFFEQSFGEPRWRPSPLAARRSPPAASAARPARAGTATPTARRADPEPPEPGGGDGLVVIAGDERARRRAGRGRDGAGWDVAAPEDADGEVPCADRRLRRADDDRRCRAARSCCSATPRRSPPRTPAARRRLPPAGAVRRLVELTALRHDRPGHARGRRALLRHARRWRPSGSATRPGSCSGRIVAQLVNEACFAVGEGVGSARGRRRRHGARPQPPARAAGVGRRDRRRGTCSLLLTASTRSTARSATGRAGAPARRPIR